MHADDERDPLDRWLSQQAQPLPPPPGTFELITRRARRRKLRKLAVTVASAAAVAAVVAIAVPVGLNLRLSQPSTSGHLEAGAPRPSATPAGKGTQSPNAAGHRTLKPSPSATSPARPSPSATSHPMTEPSGSVPTGFLPMSVTFDSPSTGWAIGQAGTPGQCVDNNPDFCTSIVRTNDAGKSWQGGPAPKTTGQDGPIGVSGIRFLNGVDGWAFGPELWSTHDEGNTWTRIDTFGARVTDLETSDGRAYALFATCAGASNWSSAQDCTSYTLMTAVADSDDWTPVGPATSGLANGGAATSAVLELTGSNGYLLAPDGALYSGPIGGTWAQAGTAPAHCRPGAVQANGLPAGALLALVNPTQLTIACDGLASAYPPAVYPSNSPPAVYFSDDGGAGWTEQPAAAWSGVSDAGSMTSLAAAPDGMLALATTSGIFTLPAGGAQWRSSSATGTGAPGGGFLYIGMTNDEQGAALPAAINLHQVWMTFDGGASWAPATSILPGN